MKYTNTLIFAFILLLFSTACEKDTIIPPDPIFRSYFNARVGDFTIYECDSLVYNDFTGNTDTFRFKIKELMESEFIDNAGRKAIRLERWKQEHDTLSWYLKDVWMLVNDSMQVEKVEEDVRFIKILFPVKEGREWNINALNSLGARTVSMKDVHKPLNLGSLSFDSTITVVNTDPENLVSEFRDTEKFAPGKGLIYKKLVNVRFNVSQGTILSGVDFTMKAIEFGKE
jgi:hypothetical protein